MDMAIKNNYFFFSWARAMPFLLDFSLLFKAEFDPNTGLLRYPIFSILTIVDCRTEDNEIK